MKMKLQTKIITHCSIFITMFIIFLFLYIYVGKLNLEESLYISASFQTFTGANVDNNKIIRNIATFQMLFSYIFIGIVVYDIIGIHQ
jgi:hypothetical protein